ncbi:hypothetical protein O3M35_003542 [Rhynocoris fuscipes]|uniref:Uncharacterized protein n=1 Tax=Rhynocoris fuscipes TaxID=488301 RepID=A0AAW1CKE5_9HEMI
MTNINEDCSEVSSEEDQYELDESDDYNEYSESTETGEIEGSLDSEEENFFNLRRNKKRARIISSSDTEDERTSIPRPDLGTEPAVDLVKQYCDGEVKRSKERQLQRHWREIEGYNQAKNVLREKWSSVDYMLSLGRMQLRVLVGILTGHAPVAKHKQTIGAMRSPLCRYCDEGVREDVYHYIGITQLHIYTKFDKDISETTGFIEYLIITRDDQSIV